MKKFNDSYYTGCSDYEDLLEPRFFLDISSLLFHVEEIGNDKFISYYRTVFTAMMDAMNDNADVEEHYFTWGSHCLTINYKGWEREFLFRLNKHPNRDKWLRNYFDKPVKELVEYIELKTANWEMS